MMKSELMSSFTYLNVMSMLQNLIAFNEQMFKCHILRHSNVFFHDFITRKDFTITTFKSHVTNLLNELNKL